MGANFGTTLEVQRFKDTGKYYDSIEVDVSILVESEAHLELARIREERGDSLIWLMTGAGLQFEVPRLIL